VKILSLVHTTYFGTMLAASDEIPAVLPRTVLKAMCSTLILTVTATYSYIGLRRVCDIKSVFHLRKISFPLNTY